MNKLPRTLRSVQHGQQRVSIQPKHAGSLACCQYRQRSVELLQITDCHDRQSQDLHELRRSMLLRGAVIPFSPCDRRGGFAIFLPSVMNNTAAPQAHTAGHWVAVDDGRSLEYQILAYPDKGYLEHEKARAICTVHSFHGLADPHFVQLQANARLIAAAPDLLAACEQVCGMIYTDKNGEERIDLEQYEQAEQVCCAAIAKAKA